MNLNIQYLLSYLADNTQEILDKIHNDPKLVKRRCQYTGLWIANAGKDLFTPTDQHQVYAKGIVYERFADNSSEGHSYKLIALGYLKIYNYEENQWAKEHLNEMVRIGAEPVFTVKHDGTFIGRFIYKGKAYLYTRGMIETMVENEEQRQYFRWAWDVAANKYPKINDPEYLSSGTALFELVGPGNQIVTYYKEWDLIMTGFVLLNIGTEYESFSNHETIARSGLPKLYYYSHEGLVNYCDDYSFCAPVGKLPIFGETIQDQIIKINELFSSSDEEGSVIQFEHSDRSGNKYVLGRVKAKTETYRKLLKLMSGCNYETISSLIKSDLKRFRDWENFKGHLMSLGSAQYPEELFNSFLELFNEFWKCDMYSRIIEVEIEGQVLGIMHKEKIKFIFDDNYDYVLDKQSRAEFANHAKKSPYANLLFKALDGKLRSEEIRDKIFPTLPEIKEACQKIVAEVS